MAGLELLAPFALVAVLALGSIAASVRKTLPIVNALRDELAACPPTREFRYTINEPLFVSRINVIELPVRQLDRAPRCGQRAAA